ncbi:MULTISPECIES: hypothetical protein [Alicyclobacillus]|uniref:acetylglutamate kinase n=1 Tax=Alicyclobacillus acidoterrestris (strain ATCC 49025 / DSM 3922 / CIP 106132 / NCIMB 13137 / GD3B) TaxID=1356854 RepID=T0CVT4_ALIAG|nr:MULTISPECIES: hypothetical protein [Alicyclobacillus]EPZ41636.1 hypothetical protein N007_16740 [Alicyclobacillus acidoterrestris ATCC 49025]UNO50534.1 acetylglutamate kinase [Alicyclobacillus acidoterrestris]
MRIVMKIGGALDGRGHHALRAVIAAAMQDDHELVLVHGGGPEITRQLTEAGIELPFVDGLRVTTQEAMPIVLRALQQCNRELMRALDPLAAHFVPLRDGTAVRAGDCGRDRVGEVRHVAADAIVAILEEGKMPLLPPYGVDDDGEFFNLNADTTAAHVARAVAADKLLLCTNVAGVFADFERRKQLYDVTASDLRRHLVAGDFSAGMIPKVQAMLFAANCDIPEVWVVDGSDEGSLLFAIGHAPTPVNPTRTQYGTRLVAMPTNAQTSAPAY